MRTAPVPRVLGPVPVPARTAAIQTTDQSPTNAVMVRGNTGVGIGERRFLESYRDWQADAKAAARTVGVARFTANLFAGTAGRVDLQVEYENDDGDWVPVSQVADKIPRSELLVGVMADYRNATLGQTSNELMRFHAWHYQVSGEGLMVSRDNAANRKAEWLVLSTRAAEWDQPNKGDVTLKFTPTARLQTNDAFTVPRRQVVRYWMPDEEFILLPVSPMTAAMEDLKRWQVLSRYAARQAQNYLAMNGLLWTPQVAHEQDADVVEEVADDAVEAVAKVDPLVAMYQEIARTSIAHDDRLESVVPALVWWGQGGDEPKWVEIGRGLDEHGMAHRAEALDDWARSVDAPAALVRGGGTDDASNHWGAWLTEERFHGSVAPLLDRMTHQDLTMMYLLPYVRYVGGFDETRWRVGYDATNVVVHPDKSDAALRAYLAGLLKAKATLRYLGLDEEDLAEQQDLERLVFVLSKGVTSTGFGQAPKPLPLPPGDPGAGPVDGPTTIEAPPGGQPGPPGTPPSTPTGPPSAPGAPQATVEDDLFTTVLGPYLPAALTEGTTLVRQAAPVAASSREVVTGLNLGTTAAPRLARARAPRPGSLARAETARYRRVLDRLASYRRDTGRRLLAGAEVALAEALRLAGVRAVAKGRNKSRTAASQVATAIENGQAFGPLLGALGITEEQLLAGAFDSYQGQAEDWLAKRRDAERTMLAEEGFDADEIVPDDPRLDEAAAAFLAAGLMALARQRIMGDPTNLDTPGEVSGAVPAQFAAQAIRIADGTATAQHVGADAVPSVLRTGAASTEDYVAGAIRNRLGEILAAELGTTTEAADRTEITDALAELGTEGTEYVWVHGFYGDPTVTFEPHLNLDGLTTTDPEGDPAFYNDEPWPDERMFFPGDHDGCTCELVPSPGAVEAIIPGAGAGDGGPIPGGREDTSQLAQDLRVEAARVNP